MDDNSDLLRQTYRLLEFYRTLNELVHVDSENSHLGAHAQLGKDYLLLCERIGGILAAQPWGDLPLQFWKPFRDLREWQSQDTDFRSSRVQVCEAFLEGLEIQFARNGSRVLPLDTEDNKLLSAIRRHIKEVGGHTSEKTPIEVLIEAGSQTAQNTLDWMGTAAEGIRETVGRVPGIFGRKEPANGDKPGNGAGIHCCSDSVPEENAILEALRSFLEACGGIRDGATQTISDWIRSISSGKGALNERELEAIAIILHYAMRSAWLGTSPLPPPRGREDTTATPLLRCRLAMVRDLAKLYGCDLTSEEERKLTDDRIPGICLAAIRALFTWVAGIVKHLPSGSYTRTINEIVRMALTGGPGFPMTCWLGWWAKEYIREKALTANRRTVPG